MKAFLYLFYHSVRLLTLTIFRLFYSKKTILNQENLKIDYPCILVSNHPNTLHDPLHVAAKVDHRIVHFLVNAGLFATPITNWFFSTFYCIKIERPQDVKGGKISNEKAFAACDAFLRQGGCLYIAPEGTSRVERHIRKMKTGAARIALSAERHNNYQLGLKILPVGLNYDNPTKFRRPVLLNVGNPISVADFQTQDKADHFSAAQALSNAVGQALSELTIDTTDEQEEALLSQIEIIAQSDDPISFKEAFFRSKKLLARLREIEKQSTQQSDQLFTQLKAYYEGLAKLKTDDYSLSQITKSQSLFVKAILYLIGFLPFLWGWINNYLVCYLPAWLNRKMKLYIGYSSTIKSIGGIFTLAFFYSVQTGLVYHFTQNAWWSLIYLFSLIPLGLFAWTYHLRLKEELAIFKLKTKATSHATQIKALQTYRTQIKKTINL